MSQLNLSIRRKHTKQKLIKKLVISLYFSKKPWFISTIHFHPFVLNGTTLCFSPACMAIIWCTDVTMSMHCLPRPVAIHLHVLPNLGWAWIRSSLLQMDVFFSWRLYRLMYVSLYKYIYIYMLMLFQGFTHGQSMSHWQHKQGINFWVACSEHHSELNKDMHRYALQHKFNTWRKHYCLLKCTP